MPTPLETEEHLRIWLLYRPGPGYDFKVEPVLGRGFRGTIRLLGHHDSLSTDICESLSDCLKQLWHLSRLEATVAQKAS